ncbi:hypothetical protein ACA910_014536 [Epithemia clementina (nom. ined.)]
MATTTGVSSIPSSPLNDISEQRRTDGEGTLIAATTGMEESPETTGDCEPEESNLLREWQYPPVAPAVVVGEVSSSSANGSSEGLGPSPSVVATFVRDFVRTSIDQMYHHHDDRAVHSEQRQQGVPRDDSTRNVAVLSIRSEADAQSFSPVVSPSHAEDNHTTTVSARTVDDVLNEEAEYILVDGDLIALPPRRSLEEGMDDSNNSHNLNQHKPCRPSRMRRGVRKIGKWFGRNKKKHHRACSSESSVPPVTNSNYYNAADSSQAVATARPRPDSESAAGGGSSNSKNMNRQLSLGETSTQSTTAGGNVRHQRGKARRQMGSRRLRKEQAQEIQEQMLHYQHAQAGATQQLPSSLLESAENGLLSAPFASLEESHLDQRTAAAVAAHAPQPERVPIGETPSSGRKTVTATPVGPEDQVFSHLDGLLPPAAVVVEYDQVYEDGKEAKGDIPASMVPVDADLKVDKGEAPDVQAMLVRAEHETTTDLETHEVDHPPARRRGKSDGSSVPLSQAQRSDKHVHNDMLKVLLVGSVGPAKSALARAIRESPKKPRNRTTLGLDVHTWSASDVNFQIWDVQGSSNAGFNDNVPNFGAHPGTQSLFFSHEALYMLVWDLACQNTHVLPVFDYDSDEEDGLANDFVREQIIAEADRALQEDISSRVLSWVDRIARRAPRSAILPVAIIPDGMEESEVDRRCTKMFEMLENYVKWKSDSESMPNIVLDNSRNVLSVNYSQNIGIKQIQKTMVAIATDSSRSVFEHVGTPVPPGTVEILEFTRSVKQHHKLIRLDHILGAVGDSVPVDQTIAALHFLSSVGEILYYGTEQDDDLSSFVILSRQWLVSALSCILRNDLKRELADARKFMNMQCIYSEQKFQENEVIKTLGGGNATSCPLLSNEDAAMLWRSMSFMREAADRYSQMNENSTSAPTMFYFLERLLVHFGIFIPFGSLNHSDSAGLETSTSSVFFVPSLLSQADPGDIWRYRAPESWTTTLCHSWLFRDGTPSDLFEFVAVALLRDLYLFSRQFCSQPREHPHLARTRTTPLGRASRHEFVEEHGPQSIGPARIHQVICWKSAMLLKIGTVFPDHESEDFRESFVEVFVTIVDQNSSHIVASDAMRANMQRVIVSGKGQSGLAGLKLFKGGYQAVLDSVQASLAAFNNVNMQVVCPECLAHGNPRRASTWGWDEVLAAAEERRESTIVCRRGHRVKSNLLCGTCKEEPLNLPVDHGVVSKSVPEILPSVVLIGLWDPKIKQIRSVGSGFVADKKFGLIVTAGHVLFNMEEGRHYGMPYMGIPDAKVVVGVIVDKDCKNAVWRYFAEVIADDVRNNVDACVLRITTKMEHDVDDEDPGCNQPEIVLDAAKMKDENLAKLKVEANFELGEPVRLLGYSQREGLSDPESRRQILRSPDFARGYVCRVFSAMSDDSSSSSDSASRNTFSPREEIVIRCPTIVGHSGGPCVNDDGLVVGILSRADPADPHRCYLVPAGQVKSLVRKARGLCTRPVYTTTGVPSGDPERYHTM